MVSTEEVLRDYALVCQSRELSLQGRKEVFSGRAKFGIFGDGKEVTQVAMAKVFKNGDFRSGYYRDQTLVLAVGGLTEEEFFAQIYAHTDVEKEPASAGRLMNNHFSTRLLDENGEWMSQMERRNSVCDISCTAGQMPRIAGLGYASYLYRNNKKLQELPNTHKFSNNGNEVVWGTIGNASTSEGHFWETINAVGVLQLPVVISIWDDEYGISVPNKYHTTKSDIYKVLMGFQANDTEKGFQLFQVKGWDYENLIQVYKKAEDFARKQHIPSIIHVSELTQPQGHSTSGAHERYKDAQRLQWEKEYDCNKKFKEWILEHKIASEQQLLTIEKKAKESVYESKNKAWNNYLNDIKKDTTDLIPLIHTIANQSSHKEQILTLLEALQNSSSLEKKDIIRTLKSIFYITSHEAMEEKTTLKKYQEQLLQKYNEQYSSHLYSNSKTSATSVKEVPPEYSPDSEMVDGRTILQKNFDKALEREPRLFIIGEDVGMLGDVNQGLAGLQKKYGEIRVTDTGIRETTIIGQGIGAAIRGLKPITEIQYLDYIMFAIQTLSDDLACLHYRTRGGQKAPLIIRSRGHRLEGVWHSGSPMSVIMNSLRGIYLIVPRNMTRAVGFYNTLIQSEDPAIVVECLNGYRLKEKLPTNLENITLPLGIPDIIKEGNDITIVTYGAMCKIVEEADALLQKHNISAEIIDIQTLLPFDIQHKIVQSLQKTNKIIFADEDVPGGTSAFMMQQVLEVQGGYQFLDAPPATITAKEHRPAYASDGDYFSKPNAEMIFEKVYSIMSETNPIKYPPIF